MASLNLVEEVTELCLRCYEDRDRSDGAASAYNRMLHSSLLAGEAEEGDMDLLRSGFLFGDVARGGHAREPSQGEGKNMGKMVTAAASRSGLTRRELIRSVSATAATAALMSAVKTAFPSGVFAQGAGPEVQRHQARLHRADRRLAADHRQGEGLLRQARPARHGGPQAGLVGRDARQHGARHQGQRHRRRSHPATEDAPLHHRQGDAEQPAAADVHAAQPQRGLARRFRSPTSTRTSTSRRTPRRSRPRSRRRRPQARR